MEPEQSPAMAEGPPTRERPNMYAIAIAVTLVVLVIILVS